MITDEQTKEWISINMKRLMDLRGITQLEIAEQTGENKQRIWRIANGLHMPSAAVLKRVSESLGVTSDELMEEPSLVHS